MNVIEVKNLLFSYNGAPILEDVSFSVEEGTFVGVIGPNGGGKTTLLKLLMGFLKPLRGEIEVLGKKPSQARLSMGWVPQHFNFDPKFPISVLEVVLGGRLSSKGWWFTREDKVVAHEVLDRVGMKEYTHFPFAELSGGQQQRVIIARALASYPKIMLLDEPTASVDVQIQKELYALLESLKSEMTILMVTHDLHVAVEHVDHVLCVQRELTELSPEKVCEHFALGLYHSPLKQVRS